MDKFLDRISRFSKKNESLAGGIIIILLVFGAMATSSVLFGAFLYLPPVISPLLVVVGVWLYLKRVQSTGLAGLLMLPFWVRVVGDGMHFHVFAWLQFCIGLVFAVASAFLLRFIVFPIFEKITRKSKTN